MPAQSFPREVAEQLDHYVYRLIDPRNGETFYVGKGQGDRVFQHAAGKINNPEETDKLNRIHIIQNSRLEVLHIIHRHGMNKETAFEVEAALIDAYPGLTNVIGGFGNRDRGLMHADHVIQLYGAMEANLEGINALIIKLNPNALENNLYEAIRFAWKVNIQRAERVEIVFAVIGGIIKGVFTVDRWLEANMENFPGRLEYPATTRYGFEGREAEPETKNRYIDRRIPLRYRERGAASPVRYTYE